jgi:type VI secretion system secreted protein VgrG
MQRGQPVDSRHQRGCDGVDLEFLINGAVPSPHLGVFDGQIVEGINQMPRVELLAVSTVELAESDLEDGVGQPVTIKLSEPVDNSLMVSRFDGAIYEFHQINNALIEKNLFIYRLVIRPWLWRKHIGANCRTFPNMSRVEVIDEVLADAKDVYYDTNYFKPSDYPKVWQILQWEESDWKFISRLMREAGINFYFSAPKEGNSAEKMHLVDHWAFFPKGYSKTITCNPVSGMVSERHLTLFETQARAVPESVVSSASFGDGNSTHYTASESVDKGLSGQTFKAFGVEGQTEAVAQQRAKMLSQGFGARRLTYSGAGDHFLIRAGEKITVGGPYLSSEKLVLVTAVRHRFHRPVFDATTDSKKINYENSFDGIRPDADIRPIDNILFIDIGTGYGPSLKSVRNDTAEERETISTLRETVEKLTATVHQLARSEREHGVMLGKVVEDTRVTERKEMTCVIESERFPEKITAKVSVAWLVPEGGVTCLPRAGMQVYFMIEQGHGGNNEAVVVGYRPSSAVPGQDPAKTIKTHRLKKGGSASSVVNKDSFSPKNRERVGVRGESATCEVTLLDNEGSVSVNAIKDVYIIADKSVSLRSEEHLHMADTVREQYKEVDRYVAEDQTEWIEGNHDMRVSKNQTLVVEKNKDTSVEKDMTTSVEGSETLSVKKDRSVLVEKNHTRSVDGDESITVKKGRTLSVDKDYTETVKKNKQVTVEKDMSRQVKGAQQISVKKAAALKSEDVIQLNSDKKVQIVCGSAKVTIEKNGNVTVEGKKFTHKASGNVVMKGSKINLN